jgi:hypothetical protein
VFRSLDPFDEPLQRSIRDRLILYPAVGYELPDAWLAAVVRAARALDEEEAYYGIVEAATAETVDEVWNLGLGAETAQWFEDSANDGTRNPIAESAIWSHSGTWGLLISHRQHIVLGGPSTFVEGLRSEIQGADEGVIDFVRETARYDDVSSDSSWMTRLLRHVYGETHAVRLLGRACTDDS